MVTKSPDIKGHNAKPFFMGGPAKINSIIMEEKT